ncbi:hypothetical protein H5T87_01170 [bacterium]|nr:hypothetical protein [bacterium]
MERLKSLPSYRYTIRSRRGLTLPEALVVSLIILLIVLSVLNIYILALRGREWGEKKASAEHKARIAMEWLLRDLRMAMDVSIPQDKGSTIIIYQPLTDSNGNIILPIIRDPIPITYYLTEDGNLVRQRDTETRIIATGIESLSFSLEGTVDQIKVSLTAREGEQICSLEAKAWARN